MQDSSFERSQKHWVELAVYFVLYSLELKNDLKVRWRAVRFEQKAYDKMIQRTVFMVQPLLMAPRKDGLAVGPAIEVQRENIKGYGELMYLQADSDWCLSQNISLAFIA